MSIDILVTTDRLNSDPLGREFISYIEKNGDSLALSNGALYYDFPTYSDYETVTHKPDVLILSPLHGVLAIRFVNLARLSTNALLDIDESLTQFCSILIGRLLKSRSLRQGRSKLSFEVTPIIYCDQSVDGVQDDLDSEVIASYAAFENLLKEEVRTEELSLSAFSEARSVLEGAKALTRASKRVVDDPEVSPAAAALAKLESEIANFDQKQRRAALVTIDGPQRIRGLAGSGKTVILAMKAAHLHMTRPSDKILVTFYTKSLRSPIKDLITKFYRHYKEVDPDWSNIHIRHGWGGSNSNGTYADASRRAGRTPRSFGSARDAHPKDPFMFACDELVKTRLVTAYYDHILIDEGQDFPDSFYQLCFELAKGDRDKKNIVWAYDELQNILKVKMRSPSELFGVDDDGESKISLSRAERYLPPGATNDTVLSKCYRNQREVLVAAHALGFGVYSDIVQLLESPDHWRDVGYEVITPDFQVGNKIDILRPEENSPISLDTAGLPALIEQYVAKDFDDEINWISLEIVNFLSLGLVPEDIIVVALDDRYMRAYFRTLSGILAQNGISVNNIHADPYSEPPFTIPGKVTLSTVYRAKGNEAAVVFALGVDALSLKLRLDRNKIFAAFTRTKAWLRVSGLSGVAQKVSTEIEAAKSNFPHLRFRMPDISVVDLIQRDLSKRTIKAKKIRSEYLQKLKSEGFTEDEIADILSLEIKDE